MAGTDDEDEWLVAALAAVALSEADELADMARAAAVAAAADAEDAAHASAAAAESAASAAAAQAADDARHAEEWRAAEHLAVQLLEAAAEAAGRQADWRPLVAVAAAAAAEAAALAEALAAETQDEEERAPFPLSQWWRAVDVKYVRVAPAGGAAAVTALASVAIVDADLRVLFASLSRPPGALLSTDGAPGLSVADLYAAPAYEMVAAAAAEHLRLRATRARPGPAAAPPRPGSRLVSRRLRRARAQSQQPARRTSRPRQSHAARSVARCALRCSGVRAHAAGLRGCNRCSIP
jgi:hypothetical protein